MNWGVEPSQPPTIQSLLVSQVPLFVLSRLLSSLWVSRTGIASDWCALQECIDTIQYTTLQYNTIQYNTIQYNDVIQRNAMQYDTIRYDTIQYNDWQDNLKF